LALEIDHQHFAELRFFHSKRTDTFTERFTKFPNFMHVFGIKLIFLRKIDKIYMKLEK